MDDCNLRWVSSTVRTLKIRAQFLMQWDLEPGLNKHAENFCRNLAMAIDDINEAILNVINNG